MSDQQQQQQHDARDEEGTPKHDGIGEDGTIPNEPDGVAAGHTGEHSTFEPEEDEQAPGD